MHLASAPACRTASRATREETDLSGDSQVQPMGLDGRDWTRCAQRQHCLCSCSQISLSLHQLTMSTPMSHRKTAPFEALVLEPSFAQSCARFYRRGEIPNSFGPNTSMSKIQKEPICIGCESVTGLGLLSFFSVHRLLAFARSINTQSRKFINHNQ